VVFTIGHSTRTADELVRLLAAHGVRLVVDVRTLPGSRRFPQFNREALGESLRSAGIGYRHIPGLGGLRKPRKDSPNGAWRNDSFRGFADYMLTPEFAQGIAALIREARALPAALLCAEAVPWRCHRSLIADALSVRGFPVEHIIGGEKASPHKVTTWARVDGLRITYPPDGSSPTGPEGSEDTR
jgi:uncharacterized protein (DUF488 family)